MAKRTSEPIPDPDVPAEEWRAYVQRRLDANRAWLQEQRDAYERRRRWLRRLSLGLLGRE